MVLEGKHILITGGTGSIGRVLVQRLLTNEMGRPRRITVVSRDEAKQNAMRLQWKQIAAATDDIIYRTSNDMLDFRIGDVRDFHGLASVLRNVEIVFHAAAMKQVPTCEYAPYEAVTTNVLGAENIARVIEEHHLAVDTVIGVSTDKACKPVSVMGMTKAIQERILIQGNMRCPNTRFICVRYGNVMASRGSVIPLFLDQIKRGGPVTITTEDMTRFLLSHNQAVDAIFTALKEARRGETYVPRMPSARVVDVANALIGKRPIPKVVTGPRPGEKIHEILVSEEERFRTVDRGQHYAILPILPELHLGYGEVSPLNEEYSSAHNVMSRPELDEFFRKHQLISGDVHEDAEDVMR